MYYDAGMKAISVEEYLDAVPEPARGTLLKMREMIRAAAPKEATEKLSYGMPSFYYKGGLMAYAAFAKHCSLFPMSGSLIKQFEMELAGYKTSKGTIQFRQDKPLPAALVKKLVKARVAENEGK